MKNFPILYHISKSKKIYSWQIWTEGSIIYSLAGTLDGKKILSQVKAEPKNEGKANATTAEEQAIKEAIAAHKFKLDRKYSLSPEEATEIQEFMPMLAQDFKKHGHKVSYPVWCDTKLDGLRSVCYWEDGKVVMKSRGNKTWDLMTHIQEELEPLLRPGGHFEGCILDGELYSHGIPFQSLTSWAKRLQENTTKIEYHIYDMPVFEYNADLPWQERKEELYNFFCTKEFKYLKPVQSELAYSAEEIDKINDKYLEQGYEGSIIRTTTGLYKPGYRSYDLLKYKNFSDEEFKIADIVEGKGKFTGLGIFVCEMEDGRTFRAVPKATEEVKRDYWINKEKYIGKYLTVTYFGLSDSGILRFPVGKAIRDYE